MSAARCWALALACLPLAGAAQAGEAAATSLVRLAGGRPEPLVARVLALARTIDLTRPDQVAAAIGPVAGLAARRSRVSPFVAYAVRGGEVIFNPDLPETIALLVAPDRCIPAALLTRHLHAPEFRLPMQPTTVVTYTTAYLAARPDHGITFSGSAGACLGTFGIVQRKAGA